MEPKKKKCKAEDCKTEFTPFNSLQKFCSFECTRKNAKQRTEKKEKERERTKTKTGENLRKLEMVKAVQAFNAFIRERDRKEPCICCGKPLGEFFHAGHFFSGGGHSAVMFDEYNVNGQRADCNTGHRAKMLEDYAIRLEKKIGIDKFELLRDRAYAVKKWTFDELQKIRKEYINKLSELKNK